MTTPPHTPPAPSPPSSKRRKRPKTKYTFKILVIGDLATGKTCFVRRFAHNRFSNKYRATIGADFLERTVPYDAHTDVELRLWDLGGQSNFRHLLKVYRKDAAGVVVVCDISKYSTFEGALAWKQYLDETTEADEGITTNVSGSSAEPPSQLPVVLLANKCDLHVSESSREAQLLDPQHMAAVCAQHGFLQFFCVSAATGENVEPVMNFLVSSLVARMHEQQRLHGTRKAPPPRPPPLPPPPCNTEPRRCC
eukprot:gnl/Spiro4/25259_TR12575_c0_g1_i1.p1 gnl/Spiro4/25259_TR12575_c0_g1~~gnl/Spiro4/25259_TR12575_c0_g1_i1.p1  ORF type:complete len:264 (+),score=49.13 gnl/Spiro4/25259_TR12575_c0_g1_i1:41-793(+)